MAGLFLPPVNAGDVPTVEMRGLWVDSARPGIQSPGEVAALVRTARAAHLNCLFIDAVRSGQAKYRADRLPRSFLVTATYDPLAEVLRQAHDTNQGPRLEVHAWVNTLLVWNQRDTRMADVQHVVRQHPDWLTRNVGGTNYGRAYVLDPGHPAAADYLVAAVKELVGGYELDGLYLDGLWYPESLGEGRAQDWGYNGSVVERFQRQEQRRQMPPPNEAIWEQFRREQLTALARRLALEAGSLRSHLRVSVGAIADANGVYPIDWERTRGYRQALQDWRGWLKEGFIDTAVPLMYFESKYHPADWQAWREFLAANQANRHLMPVFGAEFNTLTDTLVWARSIRERSDLAGGFAGMAFANYANPAADRPTADFFTSLARTNQYETRSEALFARSVAVPQMSWKERPSRARLLGRAQVGSISMPGARVEIRGRVARSLTTDGGGWYGTVDLPPGDYLVRVRPVDTDRVDLVGTFTVAAGQTARPELLSAREDLDNDGYSNEDEITAGTNPQDPQSRMTVTVTALADRLLLRATPVVPNRHYVIEAAPSATGPWLALDASASLDGSEATSPVPSPNNFFRVRVAY